MEIKKSDHRKVPTSAARKRVSPIVLRESEWLTLEGKIEGVGRKITDATRSRLLKVTNIYASSWRDPELSKSLKATCKKIRDWREDTARLRIAVWEKPTDHISREVIEIQVVKKDSEQ